MEVDVSIEVRVEDVAAHRAPGDADDGVAEDLTVEGPIASGSTPEAPSSAAATVLEHVAQDVFRAERGEPLQSGKPLGEVAISEWDKQLDELKKDNVPLIDQNPRLGLTGIVAFLQPQTTHRVLVELVQPVNS